MLEYILEKLLFIFLGFIAGTIYFRRKEGNAMKRLFWAFWGIVLVIVSAALLMS